VANKLLEFQTDGGEVLIAVSIPGGMVQPTGFLDDAVDAVEKSLGDSLRVVGAVGNCFREAFGESGADAAELELALQCTAKGSIYVAETTGSGSFKVKLTYTRK
jgi:hypothetical protein